MFEKIRNMFKTSQMQRLEREIDTCMTRYKNCRTEYARDHWLRQADKKAGQLIKLQERMR